MLGDQLREIQLVLLVTYWVLYYSLARILCYSSYSYTQILDSNNGTYDPLIMLGVACSCFIVPSGGAWYILNISCRSVASLGGPHLSQLSQVKLNILQE